MVGGRCLTGCSKTVIISRLLYLSSPSAGAGASRLIELQADFDALTEVTCPVKIDDAFCALGTTMRKAGSKEAFARVDLDYVVAFAQFAKAHGAHGFVLVSALGADPGSLGFYSRTKGQAEEAVKAIGFSAVHIIRPSLIVGKREESRPAETLGLILGRAIGPLLAGPLRRARPVHADKVAADMIGAAKSSASGLQMHYPSK